LSCACEAAENLEEAVFWQVQRDVLEAQIRIAKGAKAAATRSGADAGSDQSRDS
jgi:hypothetical protein